MTDIIQNPSFEQDLAYWERETVGFGSDVSITSDAHSGSKAVRLYLVYGPDTFVMLRQTIPISQFVKGATYLFTTWAKQPKGSPLQFTASFQLRLKVDPLQVHGWGVIIGVGTSIFPNEYYQDTLELTVGKTDWAGNVWYWNPDDYSEVLVTFKLDPNAGSEWYGTEAELYTDDVNFILTSKPPSPISIGLLALAVLGSVGGYYIIKRMRKR